MLWSVPKQLCNFKHFSCDVFCCLGSQISCSHPSQFAWYGCRKCMPNMKLIAKLRAWVYTILISIPYPPNAWAVSFTFCCKCLHWIAICCWTFNKHKWEQNIIFVTPGVVKPIARQLTQSDIILVMAVTTSINRRYPATIPTHITQSTCCNTSWQHQRRDTYPVWHQRTSCNRRFLSKYNIVGGHWKHDVWC